MSNYNNYKKQLYKSIEKQKKASESTGAIVFDDKMYTITNDGRRFLLFDTKD
jgi:hypothetical protein